MALIALKILTIVSNTTLTDFCLVNRYTYLLHYGILLSLNFKKSGRYIIKGLYFVISIWAKNISGSADTCLDSLIKKNQIVSK